MSKSSQAKLLLKSSKSFHVNIERSTIQNDNYRKVLFTSPKLQLVDMALQPDQDIGEETHSDTDQFIRVDAGSGIAILDGRKVELVDGDAIIVPAGTKHNIVASDKGLKLYTVYSPPHHRDGVIHKTKADAQLDKGDKSMKKSLVMTASEILESEVDGHRILHKGKRVPVGTVSGRYKKVAEGKWAPLKEGVVERSKEGRPTGVLLSGDFMSRFAKQSKQVDRFVEKTPKEKIEKVFAEAVAQAEKELGNKASNSAVYNRFKEILRAKKVPGTDADWGAVLAATHYKDIGSHSGALAFVKQRRPSSREPSESTLQRQYLMGSIKELGAAAVNKNVHDVLVKVYKKHSVPEGDVNKTMRKIPLGKLEQIRDDMRSALEKVGVKYLGRGRWSSPKGGAK